MNEAVYGPHVDKDTDDESLEDKLLEMNAWGTDKWRFKFLLLLCLIVVSSVTTSTSHQNIILTFLHHEI